MINAFLGCQVAAFAVVLAITFRLALFSYKIADLAFEACERGRIVLGIRRFLIAVVCGPIAVVGLPKSGSWLIFEGGFRFILGLP